MPLYPAQADVADKLIYYLDHPNYYRQQRLYLGGEMGVGKTYMGSAVIGHMVKRRPVILVVPPDIISKWHTVLKDYVPGNTRYKIFNHNDCLYNPGLQFKEGWINIIPNTYFNRLFTYDQSKQLDYQDEARIKTAIGKFKNAHDEMHRVNVTTNNYRQALRDRPFLVYDEIHKASKAKLRCFRHLMENTRLPGLFLTGTIFNMSLGSVGRLIGVTHPHLTKLAIGFDDRDDAKQYYQAIRNSFKNINISDFMRKYWRYISISISKKQVTNSTHIKKIHQTIVPIRSVKIDDEELAYYRLAFRQLIDLGKNKSVAKLGASNFLDYPQRPQEIEVKQPAGFNKMRLNAYSAVAMQLINMDLGKTKKYQAMLKYLKKYSQGKRTLIYANDHHLIRSLTAQLNKDGYKARHLPSKMKPNYYSSFINQSFKDSYQIFVVDPHDINVGVDIYADVLIWYQLLLNMSDIIQAQHRISRLSSKHDSLVIFLAYRLTYQIQLVHQISKAGKYNAASYGVQEHNNLTKLTGVLLKGIKD